MVSMNHKISTQT